jgi:hypothetical protein
MKPKRGADLLVTLRSEIALTAGVTMSEPNRDVNPSGLTDRSDHLAHSEMCIRKSLDRLRQTDAAQKDSAELMFMVRCAVESEAAVRLRYGRFSANDLG